MTKVTDPDNLDRFQVCIDPIAETISLRGLGTERHAVDSTGDSDGTTTFTDAGANFTTDGVVVGDVLTIISDPADDGGIIGHYRVVGSIGTTTLEVDRAIPASTAADLTYKINAKQTHGALGEQVADGVNGQALYSFFKEEWITLAAGLGNAEDLNQFDFPIVSITNEQFILGGINGDAASAWKFAENNGVQATDDEGLPRELMRDVGWQERAADNDVLREYANYTTLGALDADAQAYFQQGDATGDPTDYKLTGPVNQAVLTFGPDVTSAEYTSLDIDNAADTITRTAGSWVTDNYRVGDYITIRDSENTGENDGSFGPVTAVTATVLTIAGATFVTNAADTAAVVQVDHRRYTALRCRKKGKTYAAAVHADAGVPATGILPLVNKFPLSHSDDPAIVLDDGILSGGDGTATGDVFQAVEQHTSGSDGATVDQGDGTFTFTSAGSTFDNTARSTIDILQPGDSVEISSGSYQGTYEIKSIDSSTVLTCFHEPTRTYPGDETALSFNTNTGVRDVGATNATLTDIDGDTGTLDSIGSTFLVDTALGDRVVAAGDIVEVYAGADAVLGYYKVVSVTDADTLVLNTSDQPFGGQTNQSYRIWRPGMFLQRFTSMATIASATNINFADTNPDGIDRTGGSWITDGFTDGMALTVLDAEDAGNITTFIISTVDSGTEITLIAEEAVTANAADTTASIDGNITGETGIVRSVNGVTYPFHWRLFANGGDLSQIFQFLQRELRRATDIDGGSGTERGDITDLLMTFASPNGVTLDLFPDDLATSELNNVTYTDLSADTRNNAFLVGITFDLNSNFLGSTQGTTYNRLVAYFDDPDGTPSSGDEFGTNGAVIVDDKDGADMDWTNLVADQQTTFDYTNNNQGGRTPGTDAAITVVAIGSDLAQHVLVSALIQEVNSVVIAIPNPLERNYSNA